MNGISISLKSKNKVKKKSGTKKKKKPTVFGIADNDEKATEFKITSVEERKETIKKPLCITPTEPLRSSLNARPESGSLKSEDEQAVVFPEESESKFDFKGLSALRNNIPEKTNEEEYEEVPVEGFGTALLRGMGWDPSAENDSSSEKSTLLHEKPHPELVGIGAKLTTASNSLRTAFMPLIRRKKTANE